MKDLEREDWKSEMVEHELEERRQFAYFKPAAAFTDVHRQAKP